MWIYIYVKQASQMIKQKYRVIVMWFHYSAIWNTIKKMIIHDYGWNNLMAYLCNKPIYQLIGHHHWFVGPQVVVLIPGRQEENFLRRIKEQNSSCYSFWPYETQMVKMQGSDCLVFLNTMTQRGLIIPTVSKAWSLFKLHHNSKWVSDSKTAFLRARLATASAAVWHRCPPCKSGVAVAQTLRMPSEKKLWLSHEHRGLPREAQELRSSPGKSRTTVTYTTLPFPPHANTHSWVKSHIEQGPS